MFINLRQGDRAVPARRLRAVDSCQGTAIDAHNGPLTNAERQARYREKHMESVEGDKECAEFIFEIDTKNGLGELR
jgi:hypothetical protein